MMKVTANNETLDVIVEQDWPSGFRAVVDGEYDGAPDGGGFIGFGSTQDDAISDLLDKRGGLL